jgi:zinc transport system ATP-binding protein
MNAIPQNGFDTPLVSLSDAGVYKSGRWLVRGVDMTVHKGEIVTLIGPNGSGKSTSARMALGLLRPTEGSTRRKPDLRVGYVPQKLTIDHTLPLTVDRFMRLTGDLPDNTVEAALDRVGVRHLQTADVAPLSGGEFQRVMLARAIARKPELLVLDEPVQGVDYAGEIALYDLIGQIRGELQCGILLISHDIHVVMAATDTVICLNGHVCCQGSPRVVAASPEYRQLFGQHGDQTLAVYEHTHDHTHLPDGRVMHADGTVTDHCFPEDGHHHEHEHDHGHDEEGGRKSAG